MFQESGKLVENYTHSVINNDLYVNSLTEKDSVNKCITKESSTQTEELEEVPKEISNTEAKETEWSISDKEEGKSIAEQVKEVAQSALQQSGMVYVESAGMYYDYKTGYYYNSVSLEQFCKVKI